MDFSIATFEATINELNANMKTVSTKTEELRSAVITGLDSPLVMQWMADLVIKAFNSIADAVSAFLAKVGEFLEGVAAPVLFYKRAYDWITDVQTPMTDIADALSGDHLISEDEWSGAAHAAYIRAASDQPGAATAIAGIGKTMAISLGACATAGLAFYLAIGIIIVKFIAELVAGIAACGTIVFSPLGLAVIALDCGVTSGELLAALALLTAALTTQGGTMIAMKSALADFPGQEWPLAVKD